MVRITKIWSDWNNTKVWDYCNINKKFKPLTYLWKNTRKYIYIFIHTYIHMCIYLYIFIHTCTYTHISISQLEVDTYTYEPTCTCTSTFIISDVWGFTPTNSPHVQLFNEWSMLQVINPLPHDLWVRGGNAYIMGTWFVHVHGGLHFIFNFFFTVKI